MKYKILMYGHVVVNEAMLNKGIYATSVPTLHIMDATIEMMIDAVNKFHNGTLYAWNYIENLRKCEFVEVEIKFTSNDKNIANYPYEHK